MALWRYWVLARPGTPPGVDGGNWLAFGHGLVGRSVRSPSVVYPPIVPLIEALAVHVGGAVRGIAAVAAVTSVVPAASVYLVVARRQAGWAAVAVGALLLSAASVGQAAAWGGFPQLLGLGFAVLFLASLDCWLRGQTLRVAAVSGALLALLLATSHLVAGVALVAAMLRVLMTVRSDGSRGRLKWRWGEGFILLGPSLLVLPVYLRLIPALVDSSGTSSRDGIRLTMQHLPSALLSLSPDLPALWWMLTVVAVAAFFGRGVRGARLWPLGVALFGATFIVAVLTREPRTLYVAPLPVALLAACWFEPGSGLRGRGRIAGTTAIAAAAIAQSVLGIGLFPEQRRHFSVVSPEVLAAIEWVRTTTPENATVVVSAIADRPLGWWVEGLANRRTLTDAPLRWLTFPDERHRATQALAALGDGFGDTFSDGAVLTGARRVGADYVLVAKAWRGFRPQAIDALSRLHPGVVVFDNAGAVILRVP